MCATAFSPRWEFFILIQYLRKSNTFFVTQTRLVFLCNFFVLYSPELIIRIFSILCVHFTHFCPVFVVIVNSMHLFNVWNSTIKLLFAYTIIYTILTWNLFGRFFFTILAPFLDCIGLTVIQITFYINSNGSHRQIYTFSINFSRYSKNRHFWRLKS